ncbi:unnamed protein product [Rhizopus stolonifer]
MLYPKQFWIGIFVSILTNLIQSFALAFQRKSHLNQGRRLWMTSFGIYLTANLVGSISAQCVLGDPFDQRKIMGTFLIVLGTLFLGLFGVPGFIAYFSTLECVVIAGALVTHYCEHLSYQIQDPTRKWGSKLSLEDFKKYIGIRFVSLSLSNNNTLLLVTVSWQEM